MVVTGPASSISWNWFERGLIPIPGAPREGLTPTWASGGNCKTGVYLDINWPPKSNDICKANWLSVVMTKQFIKNLLTRSFAEFEVPVTMIKFRIFLIDESGFKSTQFRATCFRQDRSFDHVSEIATTTFIRLNIIISRYPFACFCAVDTFS